MSEVAKATQALCLHTNTRLRWMPRGVDAYCPGCNTGVFMPRTKLLAYSRGLLEQQFHAGEYFLGVFNQALDSGNDVRVTTYSDDARALAFQGMVQKVEEGAAELTVDFRGSVERVLVPFSSILQAQEIIPAPPPAEEMSIDGLLGEETVDGEQAEAAGEQPGESGS